MVNLLQISRSYDEAYAKAHEIFQATDPCQIRVVDGTASCAASRAGALQYPHNGQLCCWDCRHLTATGCSVTALACKVWVCEYLERTQPGLVARLESLEDFVIDNGIPVRETKEETLANYPHE